MNKQAVTFLSLFSLILVLSIYYIMLPPVNEVIDNANIVSQSNVDFEALQQQLNEKRDVLIEEYNQIIANGDSTTEMISQALESIEVTRSLKDIEKETINALKELGYDQCFVEVDGSTMKISVKKENATNQDASKIILYVLQTYQNQYQPEVKFVTGNP